MSYNISVWYRRNTSIGAPLIRLPADEYYADVEGLGESHVEGVILIKCEGGKNIIINKDAVLKVELEEI